MFTVAAQGAGDALAGGYWLEGDDVAVYYYSDNPNKNPQWGLAGRKFSVDRPCVTVMANGMHGDSLGHWHLADDGRPDVIPKERKTRRGRQLFDADGAKPPYRVPSMAEIARVRWNGLTVATTFAGCGGSSLGYRMAGYRVAWANEFVPIAAECYRLNARPATVVDERDVREIKAEDILAATGLKRGELDLLDGSPPCQAFSTAGRREKGWGVEREYEHGARQRNEDLFFEYVRLLEGLRPRAFVAENVSGLVKGVAKGYFIEILRRLKACGYRVEARVLDAQWLGVPQQRQRLIYVGVREDLGLAPAFPAPLPHRYSVRDALPWIGGGRALQGPQGDFRKEGQDLTERPAKTVLATQPLGIVVEGPPARVVMRSRFGKNRRELDVTDQPALAIRATGGRRQGEDVCVVGNSNAPHGRKGERRDAGEPSPTVMSRRVNLEVEERLVQGPQVDFRRRGQRLDPDSPAPAVAAGDAGRRAPTQFEVERMPAGRIVTARGSRRRRESGEPHADDEPLPAVLADGGRRNSSQFMVETGARIVHATGRRGQRARDVTDQPCPTVTAGPSDAGEGGGPRNHFIVEKGHGYMPDLRKSVDEPAPTIRPAGKHGAGAYAALLESGGGGRKINSRDAVDDHTGASLEGYAIGREWDKLNPGGKSDKFFNLVRPDPGKPCPTVTAEGGGGENGKYAPGGTASITHPTEKRKFTIAELRRICAYPDDFALVGSYAAQWERLGNSVPPVMMFHIASAVRDKVLLKARGKAKERKRARRRG